MLYNEHRTVNARLAELEPHLRPGSRDEDFAKSLGRLVGVLEVELPPHFAKEEEGLFPVMESVTGAGFPPIEVMKAEHAYLIEHFEALRGASQRLAQAPALKAPRSEAAQHLFPLAGTLDQHIVKEDSVLLVMAANQLGEAHDSKIMRVFDEIDREGRKWG